MIEFTNVEKTYDTGTKALKGVSFQIDDGEFAFLVGPSGSGKSTIIKLISGELHPTAGNVEVNGYHLEKIKKRAIPYLRRTVGVVFQDFRLIENKTVYENVAFAMRVIGAKNREIRKRVPYVLELVGLEEKARRRPSELSGGEQQRVAIARALAKNPKLLLCDEPTGALDYQTGKAILKLLQDMCREKGMTVIVITHNSALTPMADRVIHIKNGTVSAMELNTDPTPVEEIEW